jgi:hypothetical protein
MLLGKAGEGAAVDLVRGGVSRRFLRAGNT